MLKLNNKAIINEVAATTYRANKKRNCLTVFAIILSTFLIAVVIALGISYWDTIRERQLRMEGIDYDIQLTEPTQKQVKIIRSMKNVKYAGVSVKCAALENYQGKSLSKIRLFWSDKTCWEKQTIPALEKYTGHYPKEKNEIMFSTSTLRTMGINEPQLGMKLSLSYFTLEENADKSLKEKDFILCGWYTDYTASGKGYISEDFYKETNVKQTDLTQGSLKIKLQSPLYSEKNIIEMQNAINLTRNQIIEADYDTISNFIKMIIGLTAMLLIVFASGYLFIYNTLYISVSKDIRYYGQLKTIGMTSIQLKKLVNRQALWNAFIGIPLGLAAAAAISKIVIPLTLNMVNPLLDQSEVAPVKIWVFFIAGGFAFFTNKISSKTPARIAGDCSPIEATRYTAVTKRKNRKREGSGLYAMAMQNMFRDKKQAVIIFLSFTIAVSIYLIAAVYIRENDAKYILNQVAEYDIRFVNETTLEEDKKQLITEDKIKQLEKTTGVKSVRRVSSTDAIVPFQEDVFADYYKKLYSSRYSPGNYEKDMERYKKHPEFPLFTC